MGGLKQLYTTLDGRISRRGWWMGVLGLFVATLIIMVVLGVVGLGVFPTFGGGIDLSDPAKASAALSATVRSSAWGSLVTFLILGYPSYAIAIKRRHDRGSKGLDVQIYYGLTILSLVIQALGIGYQDNAMPGVEGITVYGPGPIISGIGIVVGLFGLYLLVVLGFLKGTSGANAYGSDPLGG